MWLKLSDSVFYFGPGGITVLKQIDLRDKPSSYLYKTELYANNAKIDFVKETVEQIEKMIMEGENK